MRTTSSLASHDLWCLEAPIAWWSWCTKWHAVRARTTNKPTRNFVQAGCPSCHPGWCRYFSVCHWVVLVPVIVFVCHCFSSQCCWLYDIVCQCQCLRWLSLCYQYQRCCYCCCCVVSYWRRLMETCLLTTPRTSSMMKWWRCFLSWYFNFFSLPPAAVALFSLLSSWLTLQIDTLYGRGSVSYRYQSGSSDRIHLLKSCSTNARLKQAIVAK